MTMRHHINNLERLLHSRTAITSIGTASLRILFLALPFLTSVEVLLPSSLLTPSGRSLYYRIWGFFWGLAL